MNKGVRFKVRTIITFITIVVLSGLMLAFTQTASASDAVSEPPSLDANKRENQDSSHVRNGEYILTLQKDIPEKKMKATINKYNGTKIDGDYDSRIISLELPDKEAKRIENDALVKTIEKNQSVQISTRDTSTQYSHKKTKIPKAWGHGLTGEGEKIAVLDTGVSDEHSDLDIKQGISTVDYTDSYDDDNGHGTHVAGIIAADTGRAGSRGVAVDADIYPVKVLETDGEGNLMDSIKGIDWAIKKQVDIINISLGTYRASPALKTKLDEAVSKGILIVASAGNRGIEPVGYPARYDQVIAVGATDRHNNIATFSSRGPNLDVVAPGKNIISTYLNNDYAKGSGTSQAAPYVSGMLALLQEQHPDKSADNLTNELYANTLDLGVDGKDPIYGRGLVQYPDIVDEEAEAAALYPDVIEGKMGGHYEGIMSMSAKDTIIGKPDGHFYPWKDVKRGQMASMIYNMRGLPAPPLEDVLAVYNDIDKNNDYAKPIAAVTQADIFRGSDGYFGEYDKLTREQMASVLVKTFSLDHINADDVDVNLDNVDPSHKEAVQILANLGITTKLNDFRPRENVTRAQVATFLDKSLTKQSS